MNPSRTRRVAATMAVVIVLGVAYLIVPKRTPPTDYTGRQPSRTPTPPAAPSTPASAPSDAANLGAAPALPYQPANEFAKTLIATRGIELVQRKAEIEDWVALAIDQNLRIIAFQRETDPSAPYTAVLATAHFTPKKDPKTGRLILLSQRGIDIYTFATRRPKDTASNQVQNIATKITETGMSVVVR